jgi:hypothetical protein
MKDDGLMPWDFKPTEPIPEEARKNKKFRDVWINNPNTKHHCYSFNEGINPNLRISKAKPDGSGNPIIYMHALVSDYDAPATKEEVEKYITGLPYVPNRLERTLSGHWRMVWAFEDALVIPSNGYYTHFLSKFSEVAFDLSRVMPGFDRGAFKDPTRLWTNSCEWYPVHDKLISKSLSQGWLVKAGQSYKFTEKEFGPAIPLETVKVELAKRYPRFAQWDGDFILSSQGPSFWIPDSTSPKSAICRAEGMQTFSAHAARGFYSWADLLGADFVRAYEAVAIGNAVENIYHDGLHYWRQLPSGVWTNFKKEDVANHLKTSRRVSTKPGVDGSSLVDHAIEHVQNHQRIERATFYVFQPPGILIKNNQRVLNICQTKPVAPADGPVIYGPDGQFPLISLINSIFENEQGRLTILAHTAWSYRHALAQEPTSGQLIFLVGPVGVGKTLWSHAVCGGLFGGFAEAADWLMGKTNFNSELTKYFWWAVDDASPGSDPKTYRTFSEQTKRVVANPSFMSDRKFFDAGMVEWSGRLCITCNSDAESLRLMPELGLSNEDKIILVRTSEKAPMVYPDRKTIREQLARELPYYGRWLLDWDIPKDLLGDSRFGIKAYHDIDLVEVGRQSSSNAMLKEILDDWRQFYFSKQEPEASFWEGNCYQLGRMMMLDPYAESMLRSMGLNSLQRRLISLLKSCSWVTVVKRDTESLTWRIERPK